MKELIKKAFKDEEFVSIFKEYCKMSQKFADCLMDNHINLSSKLIDKYGDTWTEGTVLEIIHDDELLKLSEIYRYIRF